MWLQDLLQDLRYAFRQLRRSPGFTVAAILTLAIGIGANAAVFSVAKSVLLDALPYPHADRLVRAYGRLLDGSRERGPLSAGTIADIRDRQQSFESFAAFKPFIAEGSFDNGGGPRIVKTAWVEPNFFTTLGVVPTLGRTFRDDDGTSGLVPLSDGQIGTDTARVVVATYAAWLRLFGKDPGVLGRKIRLNGLRRTVVGVLPRDFVDPMGQADFYFAFNLRDLLAKPAMARGAQWLGAVGRLKPGITREAARNDPHRL